MKLVAIVGTNSTRSTNRKLLKFMNLRIRLPLLLLLHFLKKLLAQTGLSSLHLSMTIPFQHRYLLLLNGLPTQVAR